MNKIAVVTGANRGLGKAIVKRLAEEKYDVWACARSKNEEYEEYEEYLCKLSEQYDVNVRPVYFDLTNPEEIKAGYKKICQIEKRVDVLINNAGIGHMELFQMTKMERIREIFEVNFFAALELTQLFLRNMSRQRNGKIINIVSTAADEVYVGNAIYGSSKAALSMFTKSLAAETYGYGVTVNAVAPGLIDTDMSSIFEGKDPDEPIKHTALARKIYPSEIADVIIELLSDNMKILNGEVVYVHGGHK